MTDLYDINTRNRKPKDAEADGWECGLCGHFVQWGMYYGCRLAPDKDLEGNPAKPDNT